MVKNKLLDGEFVSQEYINTKLAKGSIWYCSICHEYHHNTITKYPYDYTLYACSVGIRHTFLCNICGERFSRNNMILRDYMCKYCKSFEHILNKRRVNSYHFQPETRYYTQPHYFTSECNDFKGCGIELEVDTGGERNDMSELAVNLLNDEIYVKHDGSLCNGFEMVTYPHTYEALMSMNWQETLRTLMLYGYKSHDSNHCGLHMHISRTLFNENAIPKLMYFYDKFRRDLLLFARRETEEADRWARYWLYNGDDEIFSYDNILKLYNDYNKCGRHDKRYRAVNIINLNTVEIRLMRGTLNYESFSACCEFIYKTALNANNVTDINDLSQWLKGLSENCINYMKKRHCFSDYVGGSITLEREDEDDYIGDDLVCV